MEHNPITMGDLAYNAASSNAALIQQLSKRVTELEGQVAAVYEWAETVANAVNALAEHVSYEGDSDAIHG